MMSKSAHFVCFTTFDSATHMCRDSFIHDRPRPTDCPSQVLSRAAISFPPCKFHIGTFAKTSPLHSANLCRGFEMFPWECAPLLRRRLLVSRHNLAISQSCNLAISHNRQSHNCTIANSQTRNLLQTHELSKTCKNCKLANSQTGKLANSQTHKLGDSQTLQLANLRTGKLAKTQNLL